MIYKYKKYTESGHSGLSLDIAGEGARHLGSIDGWDYAYLPEEIVQDERLQATAVALSDTEKVELRKQQFVLAQKSYARLHIEHDVGDIYDLMADAMKMIEFTLVLASRFAGDSWGTNPIDPAKKEEFMARNKAFLDAVDAGEVTMRGDFDDMDVVMHKMFERVSKINTIVRDKYLGELTEVGL
ncbi:MAG: hypothetical protein ABXS91_10545 [Sulfurimonas sp.]